MSKRPRYPRPKPAMLLPVGLLTLLLAVTGCGDRAGPLSTSERAKSAKIESDRAAAAQAAAQKTPRKRIREFVPNGNFSLDLGQAAVHTKGAAGLASRAASFTESEAMARVEQEARDALATQPTLLVWIFDQSPQAASLRREVAPQVSRLLASINDPPSAESSKPAANKLSVAGLAFGSQVTRVLDPPTDDPREAAKLASLEEDPGGKGLVYAAVEEAARRYLPRRTQGQEVLLVLVSAGGENDETDFRAAVSAVQRGGGSVLGIAPAAPFGRPQPLRPGSPAPPPRQPNRYSPNASPSPCRRIAVKTTLRTLGTVHSPSSGFAARPAAGASACDTAEMEKPGTPPLTERSRRKSCANTLRTMFRPRNTSAA